MRWIRCTAMWSGCETFVLSPMLHELSILMTNSPTTGAPWRVCSALLFARHVCLHFPFLSRLSCPYLSSLLSVPEKVSRVAARNRGLLAARRRGWRTGVAFGGSRRRYVFSLSLYPQWCGGPPNLTSGLFAASESRQTAGHDIAGATHSTAARESSGTRSSSPL